MDWILVVPSQGFNRIAAAIGLLFMHEEDAFWLLYVVEHLKPH